MTTIWHFQHFKDSKKNSFGGNYLRKYGMLIFKQKSFNFCNPRLKSLDNPLRIERKAVMLKNPLQVTCDLWSSALVLWFVCTCAKPFPKIVPMAKLDILVLDFIYAKYFQTLDLFMGQFLAKLLTVIRVHCNARLRRYYVVGDIRRLFIPSN